MRSVTDESVEEKEAMEEQPVISDCKQWSQISDATSDSEIAF